MLKQAWICVVAGMLAGGALRVQGVELYKTGFESAEGYDPALDLAGQRGWLMEGTGGNGLLSDYFEGFGQQAYIGFSSPSTGAVTTVWRPVNFNPVPAGNPIVHFSVKMQVVQSNAGGDDDFRWAVYNDQGYRLFGVSFETGTQEIWFQNEDLVFRSTGWTFDFEGTYDFHIWMDFARNSWTAILNELVLANAEPITTTNTARTLGDVDAVWFINNESGAGNNFMVFDNYQIVTENLTAIPAIFEPLGRTAEGYFRFMVYAQKGVRYRIEATTDFTNWENLRELVNEDGTFLFEDDTAVDLPYSFYRLREIIP
ncbi:MAG: hypothetical protein ACXW3L_03475 [Limisphaerales bacterium]